ncbi:T9SS type A sorting domain-containing protein [Saccharicrinis aurantiacus]|uniref:T9SS type A sorting domain-containing protein n=1 Tax=Saccharicrinis aurantiacus TaxID=1849719 RepID=UPI00094FED7C|nr:T9SS type A sorting domain-containing protein [Saccharicrinis aurantiacus]
MTKINLRLLQAIVILICSIQMYAQPSFNSGHDPKPSGKQWVKVDNLSDEFDGTSINTSKWATSVTTWMGREPGLFTQESITVADGNLRITNSKFSTPQVIDGKTWTHGCGLVTSTNAAQVGYYFETRMKANKTFMSSTFWLINVRNEGEGCDQRTIELDINEVVGQVTNGSSTAKLSEMGSNTHSRNTSCETTPTGSAGNKASIGEEAYKDYHIYAAWWKSKSEIQFFLDGNYVYTINPTADFNLPMYIRMVTETYDWNPVPADGGMTGTWSERTTYYDWTRTWKLEDAPAQNNSVTIFAAPSSVMSGSTFDVSISYTSAAQNELLAIVNGPTGTWLTNTRKTVSSGSGTATLTIDQASAWAVANGYQLGVAIRPVGGDFSSNLDYESSNFNVTSVSTGSLSSFQNQGSFKYMSSADINKLTCNTTTVGTSEKFEIVDIGSGLVALKGSNGKYVSSENGTKELTCTRTSIGAWEKFTMVDYGNNVYALKGNNDLYVRDNMLCTSTGASNWQQFKVTSELKNATSVSKSKENKLRIYPNPASNVLYVKLSSIDAVATASIFDLQGKMVKTIQFNGTSAEINTSELSGIYLVKIKTQDETYVERVIIK